MGSNDESATPRSALRSRRNSIEPPLKPIKDADALPIAAYREELVQAFREHPLLVIVGKVPFLLTGAQWAHLDLLFVAFRRDGLRQDDPDPAVHSC